MDLKSTGPILLLFARLDLKYYLKLIQEEGIQHHAISLAFGSQAVSICTGDAGGRKKKLWLLLKILKAFLFFFCIFCYIS